jgi:hypothetical protein
MDTVKYRDGSSAQVARYVVGDVWSGPHALDFGLNRRKAVKFAQKETDFYNGSHSQLSIYGLGPDNEPYAIWQVCYGTVSRRIDP